MKSEIFLISMPNASKDSIANIHKAIYAAGIKDNIYITNKELKPSSPEEIIDALIALRLIVGENGWSDKLKSRWESVLDSLKK